MHRDNKIEVCKCKEDRDCVECVKKNMLSNEQFTDLAETFKVFGDYNRIKSYMLFSRKNFVYAILRRYLV